MANSPRTASRVRGWWQSAPLILPLIYLAAMLLYFPFRERFEFDQDEGGEVMKALLVARGYPLYSEVWSDQPPVLTYLLAATFRVLGPDVDAGRVVVLLLSTGLLAAAGQILQLTWGVWHALAGEVLIFLLPFFTTLSVSAMIGHPAIAFAMFSLLALTIWHQRGGDWWLFLSAAALGVSVLTKLFTGFLAPVFVLGIFLDSRARQGGSITGRDRLRPAFHWSLTFTALVIAAVLFVIGPANVPELLNTHLEARQVRTYISQSNALPISWYLRDAWPVLLLAGVGCLFTVLGRRWTSLYPIAWASLAYLLLSFHAPVWYHHQHLITIPAAMLAGIASGEGFRLVPQIIRTRAFLSVRAGLAALALAGFGASLIVRGPLTLPDFDRPPVFATGAAHAPWAEQVFLTKMGNHARETHWVITNLPMYAFRVGLVTPPALAFISEKRLATGELTEEQIIAAIREYRPEQVLVGRRDFLKIKQVLQADYRLLYERGRRQLYILKDLKAQ